MRLSVMASFPRLVVGLTLRISCERWCANGHARASGLLHEPRAGEARGARQLHPVVLRLSQVLWLQAGMLCDASIRGPTSSPGWKANTKSGEPARDKTRCEPV